jgi:transposase-like protein
VFPEAQVQLCLVHQVRGSLNYVSWKQRKAVAADLKPIYQASTVEDAEQRLDEFAAKWDGAYPTIRQMWRRNWEHLTPFFAYPADIRKVIYTTNAVESLNMSLRKVIKTRGSFPTQEAAMKLLYLALEHIMKKSEEEHFRDGDLPQTPRFCAFAPGFLDREPSCARTPGIPPLSRRSGYVSVDPHPPLRSV